MRKFLKVSVWSSILFFCFLFSCTKKRTVATDETSKASSSVASSHPHSLMSSIELNKFFTEHKSELELLNQWIIEDKLEFLELGGRDTSHLNKITKEKEQQYFQLMQKVNIKLIAYGNVLRFNSVIFYFSEVERGDQKVSQGYEYKKDVTKLNVGWVMVDGDLLGELTKYEVNTFIYTPLEDHWSMISLMQ